MLEYFRWVDLGVHGCNLHNTTSSPICGRGIDLFRRDFNDDLFLSGEEQAKTDEFVPCLTRWSCATVRMCASNAPDTAVQEGTRSPNRALLAESRPSRRPIGPGASWAPGHHGQAEPAVTAGLGRWTSIVRAFESWLAFGQVRPEGEPAKPGNRDAWASAHVQRSSKNGDLRSIAFSSSRRYVSGQRA